MNESLVTVGRVNGLHGIRGGIKVFSYTNPREQILTYNPWFLIIDGNTREVRVEAASSTGKGIIVTMQEITDRETASEYIHAEIAVNRDQLPKLQEGEYYWNDLLGLDVYDLHGNHLGKVSELRETGANDVLVVEGDEHLLLPWVKGEVIREVDFEEGRITVDWMRGYQ